MDGNNFSITSYQTGYSDSKDPVELLKNIGNLVNNFFHVDVGKNSVQNNQMCDYNEENGHAHSSQSNEEAIQRNKSLKRSRDKSMDTANSKRIRESSVEKVENTSSNQSFSLKYENNPISMLWENSSFCERIANLINSHIEPLELGNISIAQQISFEPIINEISHDGEASKTLQVALQGLLDAPFNNPEIQPLNSYFQNDTLQKHLSPQKSCMGSRSLLELGPSSSPDQSNSTVLTDEIDIMEKDDKFESKEQSIDPDDYIGVTSTTINNELTSQGSNCSSLLIKFQKARHKVSSKNFDLDKFLNKIHGIA